MSITDRRSVREQAMRDLIKAAQAMSSPDSWGVQAIYTSTLKRLAERLVSGVTADQLAQHADHTGRSCCFLFELDNEAKGA